MLSTTQPITHPTVNEVASPSIRAWLRIEGLAAFVAGLAVFGILGGPWPLAIPLLLVPDVSMVGYCAVRASGR